MTQRRRISRTMVVRYNIIIVILCVVAITYYLLPIPRVRMQHEDLGILVYTNRDNNYCLAHA